MGIEFTSMNPEARARLESINESSIAKSLTLVPRGKSVFAFAETRMTPTFVLRRHLI